MFLTLERGLFNRSVSGLSSRLWDGISLSRRLPNALLSSAVWLSDECVPASGVGRVLLALCLKDSLDLSIFWLV